MYIHIDLDCFFVSCERLKHPYLQGKPVVTVNSVDTSIFEKQKMTTKKINAQSGSFMPNLLYDKYKNINTKNITNCLHTKFANGCSCVFCQSAKENFYVPNKDYFKGTVVAKSYEAKALGIQTGTKLQEAYGLCPQLLALPQDYIYYHQKSLQLKNLLEAWVPVIEQYSIDEFFGDLGGWVDDAGTKKFINKLQQEIMDQLGLPVSIGASSGKWIAKLATSYAKPYGLKVVPKDRIGAFIHEIPIEKFPGIGKAYSKKLRNRGAKTLGDLKPLKALFDSWGKHGRQLYARIHGDNTEIVKQSNSRQSVGISRVFEPITQQDLILQRVLILASHLSYTITSMKLTPTLFYFKFKYSDTLNKKISIRKERIFSEKMYKQLCKEVTPTLLQPNAKLHGIVLSAGDFTQNKPRTLSLLHSQSDWKRARVEKSFASIRSKYGMDAIGYGS